MAVIHSFYTFITFDTYITRSSFATPSQLQLLVWKFQKLPLSAAYLNHSTVVPSILKCERNLALNVLYKWNLFCLVVYKHSNKCESDEKFSRLENKNYNPFYLFCSVIRMSKQDLSDLGYYLGCKCRTILTSQDFKASYSGQLWPKQRTILFVKFEISKNGRWP